MKRKNVIALGAVALATGMSFLPFQSSDAQSLRDLLRGYSNFQTGTPGFTAHQQATLNNLISTEMRLRADINARLANGTMSSSVAAGMLAELDSIAALRSSYTPNMLSFAEAQALVNRLSALETRIASSTGVGGGFGSGPIVGTAEIDTRIAQVSARINAELSAGRLTASQAANLRSELNEIQNDLNSMRSHGGFSRRERQRLISDLDALSTRVDRLASRGGFGSGSIASLQTRSTQVLNRLESAIRDRQIRRVQAQPLRNEYDNIARQISRLQARGNVSPGQIRALNERLSNLDQRITTEIRLAARGGRGWY